MDEPKNPKPRHGKPAEVDLQLPDEVMAEARKWRDGLELLGPLNTTIRSWGIPYDSSLTSTTRLATPEASKREWSDPDTITRWAALFGVSRNGFIDYLDKQGIRYERPGGEHGKSLVLYIAHLPEYVREKLK